MKKPAPSPKTPAPGKDRAVKVQFPGPFIENGPGDPDTSGPASRQEVRQETHRVNVPRQSERPVERSNQRRSRRP